MIDDARQIYRYRQVLYEDLVYNSKAVLKRAIEFMEFDMDTDERVHVLRLSRPKIVNPCAAFQKMI